MIKTFKIKSKKLTNRFYYGLLGVVSLEFHLKRNDVEAALKEVKGTLSYYKKNRFFEGDLQKTELYNVKKIFAGNMI